MDILCILLMLSVFIKDGESNVNEFVTEFEAKKFLQKTRWTRQIECAKEGVCEAKKAYCTRESDREVHCRDISCGLGQTCYLETPCPRHYKTGCRDINECESGPCKNGGTCKNLIGMYTCDCPEGFTGAQCEVDINECESDPCENGGTCNNLIRMYTCACPDGFTGSRCEVDINECESDPCENGGTCNNLIGMYRCDCPEDFTDTRCEVDMCLPQHPSGADVVFLVDVSFSQASNADNNEHFITDFVSRFPIGPSGFQIALVTTAFDAHFHFHLNTYSTYSIIASKVKGLIYEEGPSFTGKGLQAIRERVLTETNGARQGVSKYAIVLTDGLSSNVQDTKLQAELLKQKGVEVFVIATGRIIDHRELVDISSHWSRIFPISSTDAINAVFKKHVYEACSDCYRRTSDIAVMIDSSTDISAVQFSQQISALGVLIRNIKIGNDNVRISLSQFSSKVVDVSTFDQHFTTSAVISQLNSLKQHHTPANTSNALRHLRMSGFLPSSGVRSSTRKVALLVTNGLYQNESFDEIIHEAKQLKLSNVTLVTVASVDVGSSEIMNSMTEIATDSLFSYLIENGEKNENILLSLIGSIDFEVCELD